MIDARTARLLALQGLEHMLQPRRWQGEMPADLAKWHAYLSDSGHCALAIPNSQKGNISNPDDRWQYLACAPLPALIAAGYHTDGDGYVYTDLEYKPQLGFVTDEDGEDFGDRDGDLYDDSWVEDIDAEYDPDDYEDDGH